MAGLKQLLKHWISLIDSMGDNFHNTPEEKRKTTILIRASVITGIFMMLYIGNCLFIDFKIGVEIMPYEAFIFLLLPWMIKWGVNSKLVGHLFLLNGTAFGIGLVGYTGGLQSPVMPWLTLMPICAILFMDKKSAWIWAFIILAIVLVMGLYWHFYEQLPFAYDISKNALYFLNCYAGLIFIYLTLSLVFENRMNEAIEELESNKIILEDSNNQLNQNIEELKKTQNQLIQSEKMASLGELTAGIAHEIQNPLNFVNNFSEVSNELIEEMEVELSKGNIDDVKAIITDIKSNLSKISHHGKRADGIVKGMLQHSRKSSGDKELTNINTLADEYLRLAYHGFKAKDKTFNADFSTDFDQELPLVNVVTQDIGRVILNLITNAFYSVNERSKKEKEGYLPKVSISTKRISTNYINIVVKDNGLGIPDGMKEKIFQPFFTTKPTGQGTGLGLSLAYDIITKGHRGSISMTSKEKQETEFVIQLPV